MDEGDLGKEKGYLRLDRYETRTHDLAPDAMRAIRSGGFKQHLLRVLTPDHFVEQGFAMGIKKHGQAVYKVPSRATEDEIYMPEAIDALLLERATPVIDIHSHSGGPSLPSDRDLFGTHTEMDYPFGKPESKKKQWLNITGVKAVVTRDGGRKDHLVCVVYQVADRETTDELVEIRKRQYRSKATGAEKLRELAQAGFNYRIFKFGLENPHLDLYKAIQEGGFKFKAESTIAYYK